MHYSSEQNVSNTLISLARLRLVKYGRFWLLSGRREAGAEIRELPENTGDLATLMVAPTTLRRFLPRLVLDCLIASDPSGSTSAKEAIAGWDFPE